MTYGNVLQVSSITMEEICAKCKIDFDDDFVIGCEGKCNRWYHLACVDLSKKQSEVLASIKGAKWFCRSCYKQSDTSPTEIQAEIIKSIDSLKEKVEQLTNREINTPPVSIINSTPSYAAITKTKDTIVVLNKTDTVLMEADKIKEKIKQQVNPTQLGIGITSMKNFRKNGISIGCDSIGDKEKLKTELQNKIGESFIIKEATSPPKKFKIIGIDNFLKEDEILEAISKQNNINVEAKILKKSEINTSSSIAILEVTKGAEIISKLEKIKIQWRICKVVSYDSVYRCFNCFGFNHKAINCKNDQICSKCGSNKHTGDCELSPACKNCIKANELYNTDVDVNHSLFDRVKCKVLQREIEKQKHRLVLNE